MNFLLSCWFGSAFLYMWREYREGLTPMRHLGARPILVFQNTFAFFFGFVFKNLSFADYLWIGVANFH